jgi:hypothetical protein
MDAICYSLVALIYFHFLDVIKQVWPIRIQPVIHREWCKGLKQKVIYFVDFTIYCVSLSEVKIGYYFVSL